MPFLDSRRYAPVLVLAACLGAAARLWLCALAPTHGYAWDHFDTIGMGRNAARLGLFHIYSAEFKDLAPITGEIFDGRHFRTIQRTPVVLPNYPPLAISLFRVQVAALDFLDPPLRANTFVARLVMGSVPFVFELLAACGLLLIGRRVATEGQGVAAAILLWCFPPIAMNSTLWGQVDAFVLAPAVLACLFMIEERWWLAGACLGAAVMLKPQALILAPIALYGAVTLSGKGAAPAWRQVAHRLAKMSASAGAIVICIALPWTVADGFAWVRRCYIQSFLEAFPDTTLFAFNFWYIDALRHDGELVFALDSSVRVLGLSKDAWGRVLLLAALGASAALSWRSRRRAPMGLVLFSALWLWSVFFWPTRVHERFIIYCMPFVILAATTVRSYRPVLLGLLVLGVAEHSWNQWLSGPPAGTLLPRRSSIAIQHQRMVESFRQRPRTDAGGTPSEPPSVQALQEYYLRSAAGRQARYRQERAAVRPWEIALTVISLLGYAGACLASLSSAPKRESERHPLKSQAGTGRATPARRTGRRRGTRA